MCTKNIVEGMNILLQYYDNPNGYHTGAEHDEIYMYGTDREVSEDDKTRLEELDWFFDESRESWLCFV